MDNPNDNNLYSKRLCISTIENSVIMDSFKISIRGKVFMVRANEVTGWAPNFI